MLFTFYLRREISHNQLNVSIHLNWLQIVFTGTWLIQLWTDINVALTHG